MRLGIDLGTSRTVVAAEDRGNFPVIGFVAPNGDLVEHYPALSAEVDGELVHGLDAVLAAQAGHPSLASWKRLFGLHGAQAAVTVGAVTTTLLDLATSYLASLRRDLFTRSNLPKRLADPIEAVVAVPANAHSTQRFLTLEAFRAAGFSVRAMLNEPSAAGLEYAHRYRNTINSKRENVVIYDLGGGTFDAALVTMANGQHDVLYTSGVSRLGGDDFDDALLDMALEACGIARPLSGGERAALLLECRLAKESIHPSSKKITLDLGALEGDAPDEPVIVAVADYYERVRPLVTRSIDALEPVLEAMASDSLGVTSELAGIYVVGGASGLPLVPRVLRERFARRVHRSPYPSAATAIGLAIAAESDEGPPVAERFTRHLGVFRERDEGAAVSFDGIFAKGTPMPESGSPPLVVTRTYRAAHNLGHFRFVECGDLAPSGDPSGDITPHAELRFPYTGDLRDRADLTDAMIQRLPWAGPLVEERYEVDAAGIVKVTITDLEVGYQRDYVL